MKAFLFLLILVSASVTRAGEGSLSCEKTLALTGIATATIDSPLEAQKEFKKLSTGSITLRDRAAGPEIFPFWELPKGSVLAVQVALGSDSNQFKIYKGRLKRAGDIYLYLDINGEMKQIDIGKILGYSLFLGQTQINDYESDIVTSFTESSDAFRDLSRSGIYLGILGKEGTFSFSEFPKGTTFVVQTTVDTSGKGTKLYKGTLKRAGERYLYLNVNDEIYQIEIERIVSYSIYL